MKFFYVTALVGLAITGSVFASEGGTRGQAVDAAEAEYGNNPQVSKVKSVSYNEKTETAEYHVAVGIGNDEDGSRNYDVKISRGLRPVVREIDRF
jgi:hypothetical protein